MVRIGRERPVGAGPARLGFLDGLRGLAALYVLLHHAALMVPPAGLGPVAEPGRFLLRHGHAAVSVFVVLAGFGLMLRALDDPSGRTPGGLLAYLGRRARRILPPYYATLALCWSLTALVPALGRPGRTPWDRALPAFEPGVVASHLLLVHNLDGRWLYRVAPPLWSLATVWQCYLMFPALLAARRRSGTAAAVAVALAIGFATAAASAPLGNAALRKLCPWYFGLFALGMAAAVASRRGVGPGRRSGRGPRLAVAWLVVAALAAAALATMPADDARMMAADVLFGAATAGSVARWSRSGRASTAVRLLESRPLAALGARAFSLYLIHYPLLALANLGLIGLGAGPDARLAALTMVASPLCVLAAGPFRRAFEGPLADPPPIEACRPESMRSNPASKYSPEPALASRPGPA